MKSKFVSYTLDIYAAPTDTWLANTTKVCAVNWLPAPQCLGVVGDILLLPCFSLTLVQSATCRRVFGRHRFSSKYPYLLKWSIARRYNQFRGLALKLKAKSLIKALPPRQASKTSEAVTANRKVHALLGLLWLCCGVACESKSDFLWSYLDILCKIFSASFAHAVTQACKGISNAGIGTC